MEKFKNKYRIPSARLRNWDYGSPGLYFITICTENRQHYFGEIRNAEMILNELGKNAFNEWNETPGKRPDMQLGLGEFTVMPNHFHGIIIIGENEFNITNKKPIDNRVRTRGHIPVDNGSRDAMHRVSTPSITMTPNTTAPIVTPIAPQSINKFGPQSKNLGSILRGYKSSVTTYARKINIEFGWQERYHDHIIRSHGEFLRISNYILNNPANWKEDKFNNGR